MTEKTELEYKWDVPSVSVFPLFLKAAVSSGAHAGEATAVNNRDFYFDTASSDFEKRGLVPRLRKCGGGYELTVKSSGGVVNGLAERREYTFPLSARTFGQARRMACRIISERFFTCEERELRHLFEINCRRRIYTINYCGATAEMALDNVRTLVCGRSLHMLETELEYIAGNRGQFSVLAAEITRLSGCRAQYLSKVATARGLLKLFETAGGTR